MANTSTVYGLLSFSCALPFIFRLTQSTPNTHKLLMMFVYMYIGVVMCVIVFDYHSTE